MNNKLVLLIIILSTQLYTQNKIIKSEYSPLTSVGIQEKQIETIKPSRSNKESAYPFLSKTSFANTYLPESMIFQGWVNAAWENFNKFDYTYDSKFLETEYLTTTWYNSSWFNLFKNSYTYNPVDSLSTDIKYNWGPSIWVNGDRNTYSYDLNNFKTEWLYESWNGLTWVKYSRYIYTNYPSGIMQTSISQSWDGSGWVNIFKDTIQWTAHNYVLENLNQVWNVTSWENNSKHNYSYSVSDHITHDTEYIWVGGVWQNSKHTLYNYDANGYLIEMRFQNWDYTNSQWIDNWKNNYYYNILSLVETEVNQNWVPATGWVNYAQYSNSYNSDSNLVTKIEQRWDGTNWVNSKKYDYTWFPVTGVIDKESGIRNYHLFNNYPNPFNPSTAIRYSLPEKEIVSVIVYDILGRKISTIVNEEKPAGTYEVNFDAKNLSGGVYLYKFKAGSYTQTKKMILMK